MESWNLFFVAFVVGFPLLLYVAWRVGKRERQREAAASAPPMQGTQLAIPEPIEKRQRAYEEDRHPAETMTTQQRAALESVLSDTRFHHGNAVREGRAPAEPGHPRSHGVHPRARR